MITTLDIADDVFEGVEALAAKKQKPLGQILSELVRAGLISEPAVQNASVDMRIQIVRNGVPIFPKRNEKITSSHLDSLLDSQG
jgi:hypothetical protein